MVKVWRRKQRAVTAFRLTQNLAQRLGTLYADLIDFDDAAFDCDGYRGRPRRDIEL